MKITLKIPIVKQSPSGSWERYQTDGSLEIESDYENRSDLKEQANTLLAELSAEYQLVVDSQKIEEQIDSAKRRLSNVISQVQVAQNQLDRLTRFLNNLGVDANKAYLAFDEHLKLRSASAGGSDGNDGNDDIPY